MNYNIISYYFLEYDLEDPIEDLFKVKNGKNEVFIIQGHQFHNFKGHQYVIKNALPFVKCSLRMTNEKRYKFYHFVSNDFSYK